MFAALAARKVQEDGEIGCLAITAGPTFVSVVEVRSPGVEGASLVMVVLHLELPAAAPVVTELCCHPSAQLCNKQINDKRWNQPELHQDWTERISRKHLDLLPDL